MPNSNPQAVVFSNGRIRPMADLLATAYISAKKLLAEWQAQGVGAVIPDDSGVIADGSATDGRPLITDANVNAVVAFCQQLVNWMERGSLDASGTQSYANVLAVTAVAVNGQSRF